MGQGGLFYVWSSLNLCWLPKFTREHNQWWSPNLDPLLLPLLAFLAPDLDPINFFGPTPPQQTSYFNSLFSSKHYITCSCAWYLFQLDPFWVSNMCCGRVFTSRNCPQTPPLTSSWRAPWWSSWTCTAPRPPSSCRRWSKRADQGRWQLPCSQTHCPRSQTLPHIDRVYVPPPSSQRMCTPSLTKGAYSPSTSGTSLGALTCCPKIQQSAFTAPWST